MNLRDAVKPLHLHTCGSLAPSLRINRSAIIQYLGCSQLFSLKKIKNPIVTSMDPLGMFALKCLASSTLLSLNILINPDGKKKAVIFWKCTLEVQYHSAFKFNLY